MDGLVIDPTAGTGAHRRPRPDGVGLGVLTATSFPEDVYAGSCRAVSTHPNVVLLPVGFIVGKHVDGRWRPRSFTTYPTPQTARDAESFAIADIARDVDTPIEEFMAAYVRARAGASSATDRRLRGQRCGVPGDPGSKPLSGKARTPGRTPPLRPRPAATTSQSGGTTPRARPDARTRLTRTRRARRHVRRTP